MAGLGCGLSDSIAYVALSLLATASQQLTAQSATLCADWLACLFEGGCVAPGLLHVCMLSSGDAATAWQPACAGCAV
jgi:hypothetical protein